ncbi:MAG: hypothetical protein WHT29_02190 [Bacteroidales bacterium]
MDDRSRLPQRGDLRTIPYRYHLTVTPTTTATVGNYHQPIQERL